MLIDLETIDTANKLLKYLEETTQYRWASGHKPTEWWSDLTTRDKLCDIEQAFLWLDIYAKNRLFFYTRYQVHTEARFAKEKFITATEYLDAVSQNNVILLNKEAQI